MNEESSLEVSESNEKHDSRSENAITFEVSSWSKVSDEDSESRLSIFLVGEEDESSCLVSLMWLEECKLEEELEVSNDEGISMNSGGIPFLEMGEMSIEDNEWSEEVSRKH